MPPSCSTPCRATATATRTGPTGGSPIRDMAEAARELGHRYWALTDHSPRLTVAHGLNAERLRQQLDVVAELNEELAPFRILTGIEVDILEDGSLDQDDELLGQLDVVVASVHSKLRMEAPAMTRRMLAAVESPHTDILGHCTGRILVGRGRPPSTFDADAVFDGVRPDRHRRRDQLPARAPRPARAAARPWPWTSDCRGGGRHRRPRARASSSGSATAASRRPGSGVPADRVMNTLPVDEFLAWTAGHDG